jgi:hypothetical protein
MKITFSFLFIFQIIVLSAQKDSVTGEKWVDRWHELNERHDTVERHSKSISPAKEYPMETDWGLCRVSDTMLIEQTEILVQEWLDFIFYQNIKDYTFYTLWKEPATEAEKEKLIKTEIDPSFLPDKNVLDQLPEKYLFIKCKNCALLSVDGVATKILLPVEADSLKNPASKKRLLRYLANPVVGISYEQAVRFCEWRTNSDSARYALRFAHYNSGKIKNIGPLQYTDSLWLRVPYSFRLPTPQEFDNLNGNTDSLYNRKRYIARYNYKGAIYSVRKKRKYENSLCGSSKMECVSFSFARKRKLSVDPVDDIQGNVAEMTSQKGIAKGGSYFHYAKESYSTVNNNYTKPELWLGFRCVAVRKKMH